MLHNTLRLKKILYYNLLVAIFFIRLQPFYYIPFFKHFLFNTHSVARILITVNFFLLLLILFKKKFRLEIKKKKILLLLVIIYFITQSLSILTAQNIHSFFYSFKDIIFSYIFFINTLFIIKSKKQIEGLISLIVLSIFINTIYQCLIYFFPNILYRFLNHFIYYKYWEVLNANLQRGRYFIEILDFSLIPFTIYYFFVYQKKMKNILLGILLIGTTIIFSLLSNFRTHILMLLTSFFGVLIFIFNKNLKRLLFIFVVFLFLVLLLSIARNVFYLKLTIDRFSFSEENMGSIMGRFDMWNYAKEMFLGSPIFGIGLGNYYDYLSSFKKAIFSITDWQIVLNKVTLSHPHSIFLGTLAETGILGFFSLFLLLAYFLKVDIIFFKSKNKNFLTVVFMMSFWSLFSYAIFNPTTSLHFLSLFFIFRAIICNIGMEKCKYDKA